MSRLERGEGRLAEVVASPGRLLDDAEVEHLVVVWIGRRTAVVDDELETGLPGFLAMPCRSGRRERRCR